MDINTERLYIENTKKYNKAEKIVSIIKDLYPSINDISLAIKYAIKDNVLSVEEISLLKSCGLF